MSFPPYPIFPEMELDHLLLKEIKVDDIPELIEISFYDGKQAQNLAEAIEMQEKITTDYQNGNTIHWAIYDTKTRMIVGTCGYYRGFADGIGELGCVLKEQFRGKGYMKKALAIAIHFGLDEMGLHSIKAITSTDNIKAIHLLRGLEFVQTAEAEGTQIGFRYDRREVPYMYE